MSTYLPTCELGGGRAGNVGVGWLVPEASMVNCFLDRRATMLPAVGTAGVTRWTIGHSTLEHESLLDVPVSRLFPPVDREAIEEDR